MPGAGSLSRPRACGGIECEAHAHGGSREYERAIDRFFPCDTGAALRSAGHAPREWAHAHHPCDLPKARRVARPGMAGPSPAVTS